MSTSFLNGKKGIVTVVPNANVKVFISLNCSSSWRHGFPDNEDYLVIAKMSPVRK